jgi:hypothetical protein
MAELLELAASRFNLGALSISDFMLIPSSDFGK